MLVESDRISSSLLFSALISAPKKTANQQFIQQRKGTMNDSQSIQIKGIVAIRAKSANNRNRHDQHRAAQKSARECRHPFIRGPVFYAEMHGAAYSRRAHRTWAGKENFVVCLRESSCLCVCVCEAARQHGQTYRRWKKESNLYFLLSVKTTI
jgi:hypothetical protein